MSQACGELDRVAAGPELHDREVVAHLVGRVAARARILISELAGIVVPPALHVPVVEKHAGVAEAERDVNRFATRADIHIRKLVAHLARVIAPELLVAESQAAGLVSAPALEKPVI